MKLRIARFSLLAVMASLALGACASSQAPDPRYAELVEREAVIDTVNRLFIATDRKDWDTVMSVFSAQVAFDMTSLAGGQPSTMTPQQIADGWRTGLAEVTAIHHQAGNYVVTIRGNEADVFCYGIATHYRPEAEKHVTTFVGSYDFHLVKDGTGWKIDEITFHKKYVE